MYKYATTFILIISLLFFGEVWFRYSMRLHDKRDETDVEKFYIYKSKYQSYGII